MNIYSNKLFIGIAIIVLILIIAYVFNKYEGFGNTDYATAYKFDPENKIKFIDIVKPECENIKLQNILDMLTGDSYKNQKNVSVVYKEYITKSNITNPIDRLKLLFKIMGVSNLLEINDENSPYISTILMYHGGFDINTDCKLGW